MTRLGSTPPTYEAARPGAGFQLGAVFRCQWTRAANPLLVFAEKQLGKRLAHLPDLVCRMGKPTLPTTNSNAIYLNVGLTDGDVNTAANGTAEPCGQTNVIGTHGNFVHHVSGIANQSCPLQGLR